MVPAMSVDMHCGVLSAPKLKILNDNANSGNIWQFAQHLKLIGNLLEQLKISELKKYPETREPLEQLEDALRRSYILVNSCQDRSYLYLLAMGWNIVYQFRKAQNEIDRYLRLVPLITLVDNSRVRVSILIVHGLFWIVVIVLNCLCHRSCSFKVSLEKNSSEKGHKKLERNYSDANSEKEHSSDETYHKKSDSRTISRNTSSVSSGHDLLSSRGSHWHEEWHTDLLGCCSEPSLCIKTFFYPCGTLSKIATVATNRHMSPAEACNELMAYSLILSCCCYTCCIRRKLRKVLNITGGFIDDFLSHFMCCCCALVQEWREVEIRGAYGPEKTKTSPPPSQYMES
ncbi:hypothetical protein FNV43_RR18617 [Rhamnella rubrinervis]|uniref:MCAfunc domain-containing protein n=1 Tax=Rhamnella rubrinervis TaxID=2594499 RepID=A0A8K0E419_9ROSA|nr:hypothetical protein FNV43_RR18617 [Rhamnella rubrinervis]